MASASVSVLLRVVGGPSSTRPSSFCDCSSPRARLLARPSDRERLRGIRVVIAGNGRYKFPGLPGMDTLLMEEAFTAISRTFDEAANSSSAPLLKGTTSGGMTEAAASASAAAHEASFATQCEVCDADADGCACCADVSVEPKARVPDGSKARVPSWPVPPGFGTVSLRGKMASMVGKSRAAPAALSHRPLIDCHQHCQANDAEGLENLHRTWRVV